jgi:ABC-type branched-subunit amino acid transport system ATPase component
MLARAPVLEIEDVQVVFGGLLALDQVSFSIQEGGVSAVIGPNGAGKSTLFNVISGLQRPTAGRVRLSGLDVTHAPAPRIMRWGLSRTFQRVRLAGNMDVLNNVLLGLHARGWKGGRASRARAREALQFVSLGHRSEDYPAALTLGERKRVEIARALVNGPRLVLLDEPFAGLSADESSNLAQTILRLDGEGATTLLIEHDMELVMRLADHIVVLNFGRKLAEGTPAHVRGNPEVVEAYLGAHV